MTEVISVRGGTTPDKLAGQRGSAFRYGLGQRHGAALVARSADQQVFDEPHSLVGAIHGDGDHGFTCLTVQNARRCAYPGRLRAVDG